MKRRSIFLTLLSAILLLFSFPKFGWGPLAWVALIPFFLCIRDKGIKETALLSFLTGATFFGGILYWLTRVTILGTLCLVLYLSLYFVAFGLLLNFTRSRRNISFILLAPSIWVSLELLRAHLFTGFPWALLGYSQYRFLPLIQVASFSGVYGISFLIVGMNAVLFELLFGKRKRRWGLGGILSFSGLLTLTLLYGKTQIYPPPGGKNIKVYAIQGNIPQEIKFLPQYRNFILNTYLRMTEEASRSNPQLIIWPETAVPGFPREDKSLQNFLRSLARGVETPLLVGGLDKVEDKFYNSAFLITPDGEIAYQYNKIHLVPWGEYVPFSRFLPFLRKIAQGAADFSPGQKYTLFPVSGGGKFGVLICYEGIFPHQVRHYVQKGAQFLVNITNEAWYGKGSAPYQHLSMYVFRAIENRTPIIRAANTGISCFIDSRGRIVSRVRDKEGRDIFVPGILRVSWSLNQEKSPYTRWGDLFAYLNFAYLLLVLAWPYRLTSHRNAIIIK